MATHWSCNVIGCHSPAVHSGHLNESLLVPDGWQIIRQAANLAFESTYRLL